MLCNVALPVRPRLSAHLWGLHVGAILFSPLAHSFCNSLIILGAVSANLLPWPTDAALRPALHGQSRLSLLSAQIFPSSFSWALRIFYYAPFVLFLAASIQESLIG